MAKTKDPAPSQTPAPSPAELVRMPLVLRLPGMEDVRVRTDMVYRQAEDAELKMDVYSPGGEGAAGLLPAVVFIHGGPIPAPPRLQPKEWAVYKDYGKLAAASGLVGITFNHGYYGVGRLEEARVDIETALEAVRDRAGDLGVDKERLALWAFSGGGAFLSGFLRRPPEFVRALVSFYAILDLRPYRMSSSVGGAAAMFEKYSPAVALEQAPRKLPPLFVGRAGLDDPLINVGTDGFVSAAIKKNIALTLWNHPSGFHGFDIRNDDPTTRAMLRAALDFLRAHLE